MEAQAVPANEPPAVPTISRPPHRNWEKREGAQTCTSPEYWTPEGAPVVPPGLEKVYGAWYGETGYAVTTADVNAAAAGDARTSAAGPLPYTQTTQGKRFPRDGELHMAANRGDVQVMQGLLDAGVCDVNARSEWGATALHRVARCAAREHRVDGFARVCVWGGKLTCRLTPRPDTHLRYGHVDACALLLARGCDVNAVDRQGWTALHVSAANDTVGVAEQLLESGADTSLRTDAVGPHAHASPATSAAVPADPGTRGAHTASQLAVSADMRRLLAYGSW